MADPDRGPNHGPVKGAPRYRVVAAIIVAVSLFGLIVFLHLIGAIGPGAH
jgi:hypothetical protein